MGHRAILWHGMMDTVGLKPTWDIHWDPLYSTIEEMGVPVSLHLEFQAWGQVGIRPQPGADPKVPAFLNTSLNIAGAVGNLYPLIEIVMSGMLERHPRLKVYFAEGGASWAVYVLGLCDFYWQRYTRDLVRLWLKRPC
jgi:predicted TIM-barrel fold metal-dependent hydrolase